jgi:cephalosporin hydroxylase
MRSEHNMDSNDRLTIDGFHNLYYDGLPGGGHIFQRTFWMGVECLKCPLDLWVYQEIFHEIRPDLVVETGTHQGGSALFMAHMMDVIGKGEIVTIDIREAPRPTHPRIRYAHGSSVDPVLLGTILDNRADTVRMVILDSDHSESHVTRELELLSPYVTSGSYLVVEDTNINGHPAYRNFGPGPFEAVEKFLARNSAFEVDATREKFLMTFNPRGFLRRIV